MKATILLLLTTIAFVYVAEWIKLARATGPLPGSSRRTRHFIAFLGIGFGTNFLDTLGVGSFATTTAAFRFFSLTPDEMLPGTLNVGHAVPTVLEALMYITFIDVGLRTLGLMIGASVLGAWLGAGVVAAWSRRHVQIGMSLALMVAAGLMVLAWVNAIPGGGAALSLTRGRLLVAAIGNLVLGALMTMGIGLYAPCMILVSLLGMNPKAAFPIMMGSCAFLMPVGGLRFIRKNRYDLPAAPGLTIGGLPGVLLAALVVKSLPLSTIRVMVVGVVIYTSIMLIRTARFESRSGAVVERAIATS